MEIKMQVSFCQSSKTNFNNEKGNMLARLQKTGRQVAAKNDVLWV